jgi:ubiquinone/menaquinone biosynthesis C-methylase UbiE
MKEVGRNYLPAAGRDSLLPLYDPLVKLLGFDRARNLLLDQAAIRPSDRVLDVGCGTGTFATLIKRRYPDVDVVGLDPDPKALARARRKAGHAAGPIQFDQGFSDELPYPDASFDRVFSCFMFHHLEPGDREKTLREVRRALKPGGTFHLLDFGGSSPGSTGLLARMIHASHRLKDNFGGRILTLMSQAGLADAEQVAHRAAFFGQIVYYRASANAVRSRVGPL